MSCTSEYPTSSAGSLRSSNGRSSNSIRRVRRLAIYSISTVLYLILALPGRADLITNGNFSQTNPAAPTDGFQLTDGTTSLTDWDFEGSIGCLVPPAAVDACGAHFPSLYKWTSPLDGSNFVALDADTISTPGSLSQTISGLTPGQFYTLTFMQAAAQFEFYNGPTTEYFQVTFGSQVQDTSPIIDNPTNSFTGWFSQTMTFQASAATQTLTFLAGGTPMGEPPTDLLADVSLVGTSSSPEPTTWALVLLGIVAAGVILKWRKART